MAKVTTSVLVDAKHHAGGKPARHAPDEAAVQRAEDLCRIGLTGFCAKHAHDHGDIHARLQALAADIAQGHNRGAVIIGNDLKEVAADLHGRLVGAGDSVTLKGGQSRRDKYLLDFAPTLQFAFHHSMASLLFQRVAIHGIENGRKENQRSDLVGKKWTSWILNSG